MDAFCSLCSKSLIYLERTSDNNSENEIVSIICGHLYHSQCLIKWLKTEKKCPECRKIVENDTDVHKIYFNKKYTATDQESIEIACIDYRRKLEKLTSHVEESNGDVGRVEVRLVTITHDLDEKDRTLKHLTQMLADEKAESSVMEQC